MSSSIRDLVLKDVEKRIDNLPLFSPIIPKVLKVIENPVSSAIDIEKVVKYDQVLASKILKIANSAYYGYGGKISTISQGIVILGLNTLRALLFTATASRALNKKLFGYKLGEGEYWKHSVLTAVGARTLAAKLKYANVEEVFVAGLLHDIGKIVLDPHVARFYNDISNLEQAESLPWEEAERRVLGINHAYVGRRMANKWNFPPSLEETIAHHHHPERSTANKQVSAIIFVANIVSIKDDFEGDITQEVFSILNLNSVSLFQFIPQIKASFKEVDAFLAI